ncbi:MAG: beta-N-acetylhexosaminidase [Epulopiscium sp.]|nr:beta-N-acetylhexosaminidase [Candidatus Epulonipiscium sp.]
MYKLKTSILFIVIFVLATGCLAKKQEDYNKDSKLDSPKQKIPIKEQIQGDNDTPDQKEINLIEKQISRMTLDEKIGQLVIVGFEGYMPDENIRDIIENYHVGGVILFGRNVENSTQLLGLTNALKGLNSDNKIPLFISVDEEGGMVSRMPNELLDIPDSRTIGKKNDKNLSHNIGRIIAKEIKSFGFNMNFAPVLDVDSNKDNPVIGERSFSSDVKIVSELGIEAMKGMKDGGAIPIVKHFPGHGDTSIDSHVGLPVVNKDLDSLKELELAPFMVAIDNGAEGIMIAHILFNQIDAENPASLSNTIITDILRKELNYKGIVITDDLTMGAIIESYGIGDAAVKSINAGSDIILVCHGYENEIEVLNRLKSAVENGILSKERIDESVYRILSLKEEYVIKDEMIESIDINKINSEIDKIIN